MSRACAVFSALVALLSLIPAGVGGCESKPPACKLQVLAAASLAGAFREIGTAFEAAHPGAAVQFSFGGSNRLRTQLEHGGPGDVFASADRMQMEAAVKSKVVDPASVRLIVHNSLAIIVPRANRAAIGELAHLARPGLKIVVADRAVPVGAYTRLMLEGADKHPSLGPAFVAGFEANTVSREENVASLVAKVALDEADAGIAYATDAAGDNGSRITALPLPPELEQLADYLAAVTARTAETKLAAQFIEFLSTREATAILNRYGFTAPTPGAP